MQMTWRPPASARSWSPTARAVWPPMPASTSSKTSVAGPGLGRHAHQREHHARELAARRDVAQRAGRDAGVRRDHELDVVGAARARLVAVGQARLEARAVHRELAEHADDRVGEAGRRGLPRRAQLRGPLAQLGARVLELRGRGLGRLLRAGQLVAPGAARLGVREHRGDRAAVLALELLEQREPLLDLVEPARRRVDALAVAAQLARQVVGLDDERRHPVREGVQLGVDAADRLERVRGARERRGRPALARCRARAPRSRPRRRAAGPRGCAAARAPRPGRPPRPRSAPRCRSPRAPTRAGRARGRARRRARAAPRAARAASARARAPPANAARRTACSGPQKPSRISSCEEASVSRRCSCWP